MPLFHCKVIESPINNSFYCCSAWLWCILGSGWNWTGELFFMANHVQKRREFTLIKPCVVVCRAETQTQHRSPATASIDGVFDGRWRLLSDQNTVRWFSIQQWHKNDTLTHSFQRISFERRNSTHIPKLAVFRTRKKNVHSRFLGIERTIRLHKNLTSVSI